MMRVLGRRFGEALVNLVDNFSFRIEVDLIKQDKFGFFGEYRAVTMEFGADTGVIMDGVTAVGWEDVQDVDEDTGAFDVSEELVSESGAGVCAFDEAGDIGHDKRRKPLSSTIPRTGSRVVNG